MGSFSETYHDPRFPEVSTSSIQKSEVLQGVTIVQDMHNPVPLRRLARPSRSWNWLGPRDPKRITGPEY